MGFIISLINITVDVVTLLVIIQVLLSFFMSPYHPIRQTIDRIIQPMLDPIRRVLPQTGMLDFSPMVLILLLYIVRSLLIGVLRSIS
ncbi:MAG: YggT family protein [Anaerolineales bacterium]|nr:MAG: YggT family protein [Anaerolineales bacterium]